VYKVFVLLLKKKRERKKKQKKFLLFKKNLVAETKERTMAKKGEREKKK
jgi:hypothetical protein